MCVEELPLAGEMYAAQQVGRRLHVAHLAGDNVDEPGDLRLDRVLDSAVFQHVELKSQAAMDEPVVQRRANGGRRADRGLLAWPEGFVAGWVARRRWRGEGGEADASTQVLQLVEEVCQPPHRECSRGDVARYERPQGIQPAAPSDRCRRVMKLGQLAGVSGRARAGQ